METMTTREFYESFNELDSSNDAALEFELFQPQSNSNVQLQPSTPTSTLDNLPFNFRDSETSREFNDNQILRDQIENQEIAFSNLKDISFLPTSQPETSHQVIANKNIGITNQNFSSNRTLKDLNERLGHAFKNTQNIKWLPYGGKSASGQDEIYRNKNFRSSSSINFSNHTGKVNNTTYTLNDTTSKSHLKLRRDGTSTFPTYQHGKPRSQSAINNGTNNYIPWENMFNNLGNLNSLPLSQPATSRQAYENQYDYLNNISNGNTISPSSSDQFSLGQIHSDQYFDNSCFASDKFISHTRSNMVPKGPLKMHKENPSFLPNITIIQCTYNPNCLENIHSVPDKDSKVNQKTINPYEQMIDISKTNSNCPPQKLANFNTPFKETINNTSININNINSINVHVNHRSNFPAMEGNNYQQFHSPLAPPLMNIDHDLWPHGQQNVNLSTIDHGENFVGEPSWMPMEPNSNEAYRYIEPTRSIIRDDIYLPASEESCQSLAIDDWLHSIEVTPLQPYVEQSTELFLGSEATQAHTASNPSKKNKKGTRGRSNITEETLSILKRWFEKEPYPSQKQKEEIAEETGHSVRTVGVWFQNRRQIIKKDYMKTFYKENTGPIENKPTQSLERQTSGYFYPPQAVFNIMRINDKYL